MPLISSIFKEEKYLSFIQNGKFLYILLLLQTVIATLFLYYQQFYLNFNIAYCSNSFTKYALYPVKKQYFHIFKIFLSEFFKKDSRIYYL